MKNNKNLSENLEERAKSIVKKLKKEVSEKKEMEEWDGQVTLGFSDSGAPTSLYYVEGETTEELKGKQHKLDVAEPKGKLTADDFKKLRTMKNMQEKWEGDVEVEKTGEYADMSIEQINSEIKKLKSKTKKYKDSDKPVPKKDKEKMSELYFAKRAKQGWKGKGKAKVGEGEMEEGNEFTGALAKAKKEGKKEFTVGGKTFPVKESKKTTLTLTESEMIDLIERIVKEQTAKGLAVTNKVLAKDKKENDDYLKSVTKKMKDYLKTGSKGTYSPDGSEFPKSNYTLDKESKIMKYNPSEAVDEYIDAFSYPGQTNLRFDEIGPDEKKIEKYLKGDSTTGNAVTDKDGKALGNVVNSKVGDKFMKNFEENLYGAEQADASYKRQSQPVDFAGDVKKVGKMKKKASSDAKSNKIMKQLESTEDKKNEVLSEEFNRMKNLIDYKKKTQ